MTLPPPSAPDAENPVLTSERTPLLNGPKPLDDDDSPRTPNEALDEDRPLPRGQILLLCYARIVEPISYFCIFPFINQMILDTGGIAETDVGFYSGLIESIFSMTQMLTMIFWGRAADRWGRKPVLVSSLAGLSIAVSLFGVSKTIPQMILFRSSAGMFAGTIVTVRAMVTENSTAKTQARAFSFFAFAGNVGIFLGPLIGGGLSSPAVQYPRLFGWAALLKSYPYALPTFVCGSISLSAAVLCFLFIKETLVPEAAPGSGVKKATVPIKEILRAPGVLMVLYLFSHVNLLGLAYTAVMPVFWFTAPVWGGFGFSPFLISVFLAIAGASQAVWLLLIFPPLQHRFGTGGVLRGCATAWPVFFIISPVCSLLRRYGYERAFWTLGPVSLAVGSGVSMGFTGAQLALNDIAPSSATLGTLNALALTLASAIRMVAPALFSSIFAWGVRNQILMGYLIWVVLVAVAVALAVTVHWLPEKAEGRLKPRVEEEEHA